MYFNPLRRPFKSALGQIQTTVPLRSTSAVALRAVVTEFVNLGDNRKVLSKVWRTARCRNHIPIHTVWRFSHRQSRIPESFEQFFQASGIGNRYQAEKI